MTEKVLPLVSVIVTTFNRAEYITEALESIYEQSYKWIEIVIIDDASTDPKTLSVVKECEARSPFPLTLRILEHNGGAGAAREAGRQLARGHYIQYLDSDDLLAPDKIARQVAALELHRSLDIAYGLTLVVNENGDANKYKERPQVYRRSGERWHHLFPEILNGRLWATSTPLYRAELLQAVGPWLPLRINEDVEYEYRLALASSGLYFDQDPVAFVRLHPNRLVEVAGNSVENLRDRVQAYSSIVDVLSKRENFILNYKHFPDFVLNLFFMARKAASINDRKAHEKLLSAFLKVPDLPNIQRKRAAFFQRVVKLFGVKTAGRLANLIERVRT